MSSFCEGGREHFLYAEHHDVDFTVGIFARAAKKAALTELGITPAAVELKFFKASDLSEQGNFTFDRSARGIFFHGKDAVWVLSGRDVGEAVETTVHECRHAWQYRTGFSPDDGEKRERDAVAWARTFVAGRPDLLPERMGTHA